VENTGNFCETLFLKRSCHLNLQNPRKIMLSSLVYQSKADKNLTAEMIELLIKKSIVQNKCNQVSGLLFYEHPFFFQVLEGPEEYINQLLKKILSDSRHTDLVVLSNETIKNRKYPTLGMHYLNLEMLKKGNTSINEYRIENNSAPVFGNLETKIEKFINQFIQNKYISNLSSKILNYPNIFRNSNSHKQPSPLIQMPYGHNFTFQPILDLSNKKVSFVEVLARGPFGENANEYFINMNENELERFDTHSTEDAICMASQLKIPQLSINFDPSKLFQSIEIAKTLPNLLKKYGFETEQLIIEITEKEFIKNFDLAPIIISTLRSKGIKLAIDDFGAGYAGLSLLAEFQPDIIKIDQCLSNNIHSSGPKQSIVKAINNCANELGISVVAEGIENNKDLEYLTSVGLTQFQGFLFNIPEINTYTPPNW